MGIDNEQVGFLAQIYYDIEETNFSKKKMARKLSKKDKNFFVQLPRNQGGNKK